MLLTLCEREYLEYELEGTSNHVQGESLDVLVDDVVPALWYGCALALVIPAVNSP